MRDSRGLTYMNALNPFKFKIDDIELKGRFVNLFGDFSPLCPVSYRPVFVMIGKN